MPNQRTLGTLLRHLVELLDSDVETGYREAGLDYRPRYTPVMRLLTEQGPSSIRAISRFSGITHSAASQTVADMVRRGLVRAESGEDGRERIIRLTKPGEALLPKLKQHWQATNAAAAELSEQIGVPLEDVIARAIAAVEERSFLERIQEHRGRAPRTKSGR